MNTLKTISFDRRLTLDDSVLREADFNPYYPEIQSALNDPVFINGKNYINLASNNYLGLANDPRIKNAAKMAIDKYGVSMCGTPVASGYNDLFKEVETKLSIFLDLEKTLIYPSCYQANNGLFKVIARKDDVIIVDKEAHSSLLEGIKAAGCTIHPFLHNDLDHLEKQLKKVSGQTQAFVVTESVFSTEGSIAPFGKIYDLCCKYGAIPVIDDSHGIGVIGKSGKGILEYSGISDYQGFYTASLGKALANMGGIISGPAKYLDYMKYYSSHLVYSTAILPSVLAGIETVIDIIESEFASISEKMWRYKNRISGVLKESGWPITNSVSPITSVITGTSRDTLILAKALFHEGIIATPFVYPSVRINRGTIRLIAGSNLKEESIDKACGIFKTICPNSHEVFSHYESNVSGR